MKHTDHFHPAVLALTVGLLTGAAFDASHTAPEPFETRAATAQVHPRATAATTNEIDSTRAQRTAAGRPDAVTRIQP